MSLEELRRKIDETDARIVGLIGERLRIAAEIGRQKRSAGKQVKDEHREVRVLDNIRRIARENNLDPEDIARIYSGIIGLARSVQEEIVAFQGEAGAYGEEAAFQFFGPAIKAKPCESLDDVFKLVETGVVNHGIVPIENSLEGSISRVYDLLLDSSLKVCGETELRISHCLIANPGVHLGMVKKVYSHPQALAQSRSFLRQLGAELVPTYNTAASVKMIKEQGISDGAAIGSSRAAEIYGLQIIAREIEDNPHNFTRFFVLARDDSPPTGKDKTSIVFSVRHKPGSLYELLGLLARHGINLTKIESRPTRQKPWEYNFYLDFEGHREDKITAGMMAELEKTAVFLKVLGSYPRTK